jgi:dihydroorotate dehydrogenase
MILIPGCGAQPCKPLDLGLGTWDLELITMADLCVEIAGVRLKNPVLAASGTFGYGVEFAPLVDLNRLGGIIVKGLSREPMPGNAAPRLHETPSGMLNAVGLQNIGASEFVRRKLPELRRYDTAAFANVFGYATEDYVEVIRILESGEGLAGYELNVSCPNTKRGGISFGADPYLTAEVTAAAAVQVGTARYAEPRAAIRIIGEIERYCRKHAIASVRSLVGTLAT